MVSQEARAGQASTMRIRIYGKMPPPRPRMAAWQRLYATLLNPGTSLCPSHALPLMVWGDRGGVVHLAHAVPDAAPDAHAGCGTASSCTVPHRRDPLDASMMVMQRWRNAAPMLVLGSHDWNKPDIAGARPACSDTLRTIGAGHMRSSAAVPW